MQAQAVINEKEIIISKRKLPKTVDYAVQFILYFLIALSLAIGNSWLMLETVLLTLIYALVGRLEFVFYLIVSLAIYQNSFTIFGRNAAFAVVWVFLFRMLLKSKFSFAKRQTSLVCMSVILLLEFATDFFIDSWGEFLVVFSYVIFFLYVLCNIDVLEIDVKEFLFCYTFAFLAATVYVFHTYGGVVDYLTVFLSAPDSYRFAIAEGTAVGGAMEIPLHALLIISVSVVLLLERKDLSTVQKVGMGAIIVYTTMIGALTISRSFILGGAIILLLVLVVVARTNTRLFFGLLLMMMGLAVGVYILMPNVVERIFLNFFERITTDTGGGSGRGLIWINCIKYLLERPMRLLFGCGASRYVTLGVGGDVMDMGYGAHNLFLDVLMSWGGVGFVCVALLVVNTLLRIKKKKPKQKMLYYIPLITYFAFAITALRAVELVTWSYLIVCILVIKTFSKERNKR